MIRRLILTNWRAYEAADIPFEPGTTFVVAPNGIGKTSLLEAARFALTGRRSDLGDLPVRLTADRAEVQLTLQLPEARIVIIRRELFADPTVPSTFHATQEGDEVSESELTSELEATFDAAIDFVARNAFLTDSLQHNLDVDLRSQLCRAFGLDDKAVDAARLAELARMRDDEAKALRRASRLEKDEITRLEGELGDAKAAVEAADEQLHAARVHLDTVTFQRDAHLREVAIRDRFNAWENAITGVLDTARLLLPEVTTEQLGDEVEALVASLDAEVERARTQLAAMRARVELVETSLNELDSAEADCPVCLRPLTDHDRASAKTQHMAERDHLRHAIASIDESELAGRLQQARALLRQVDAIGPRPSEPSALPDGELNDLQTVHDQARMELERAVATHAEASARVAQVAEALEEAKVAEERSQQMFKAWRRWALTSAASTTLSETINRVLTEQVEPMAAAVRERWNSWFADRPELQFDLEGKLWRDFHGHRLDFGAFSTGERTAARLLMQLAILTATTSTGFCWVDEPLEHLDPKTRRLVAGMVSRGREATGLRQLVVTTYEEELAQRLAEAEPNTMIQYVRAGANT